MRSEDPHRRQRHHACDEGDDRVVALLAATADDRLQAGLSVAQLVENLLDHRLVDGLDLGLKLKWS